MVPSHWRWSPGLHSSSWDTPHKLEEAPSLVTVTMTRQPQLWIRRGVWRYCSDQVFVCFGWMELGGDGTIFRDGKKGVCLLIKSWVSLPLLAPSSIAQDPSVPSSPDSRLNIIKDHRVQQRIEFYNFYNDVHTWSIQRRPMTLSLLNASSSAYTLKNLLRN